MKIKLDENVPIGALRVVSALGIDADTVPMEGLAGASDDSVWAASRAEGRVLVTLDTDFADERRFVDLPHPGVVVLRLKEPTSESVCERLEAVMKTEIEGGFSGKLVVITDTKVRVRPVGRSV